MAVSCQFWGKDSVLKAFDLRGVDVWAIFQGKAMITKGDGAEDLSSFLDMLSGGYTQAIYTLKIYESSDVSDVKDNTPSDGSFNFQLSDTGAMGAVSGPYGNANNLILQRLDKIEKQMKEGWETETIGSAATKGLINLLQDPDGIVRVLEVVGSILGRPIINRAAGTMPAADTPVKNAGNMGEKNSDEVRRDRLVSALNILEKHDPDIIEHLEKLAILAQDKPFVFKQAIQMLGQM